MRKKSKCVRNCHRWLKIIIATILIFSRVEDMQYVDAKEPAITTITESTVSDTVTNLNDEKVEITTYGEEVVVIDKRHYETYVYSDHEEDWPDNYSYYLGETLSKKLGSVMGPTCEETYYNLPMNGVVNQMVCRGIEYEYWVRKDGVKMYGEYIILSTNLDKYPRGTILKTTLGYGIVCDECEAAYKNNNQIDVAVTW